MKVAPAMSDTIELPLFPLSTVLLPHGRLPLQIFEQRYLDLVRRCMRQDEGFGVVLLEQGTEVRSQQDARVAATGTLARIVDWDQLPSGLLGITIEGCQRFNVQQTHRQSDQLLIGTVSLLPVPAAEPMLSAWQPVLDVLLSLQQHPHVQRMGLQPDTGDAWQVAYALLQLLPLPESAKAALLQQDSADALMRELMLLLNELGGAD
jgi:Lon protease-like protein